jgi:2-polyprenyl-3-methyl-5-hydroxy-6-metoxy-1,4-benzoquinol methylase
VARFAGRTYFRCGACGLLYMVRLAGEDVDYGHGYFFEQYRQQYGRTYLEDFDAIRRVSLERLAVIERLIGPVAALRLLDVGCAFGPFIAAALSRGAEPSGIEVSAEAAAHVRGTLGVPCWNGRFQDFDGGAGSVEVLSMWYVIEHFAELDGVLRQVNRLLSRGGLFAFSTPNARGISGRARPARFLEESPADHFTIWDPPRARRVLSRYGFRLARVRVTGHHPERFPGAGRLPAGSARLRAAAAASRLLGLGDTFEAYAIKVRDTDG